MEGFEQGNVKLMDVFRDPFSVFGGKLVIAAVRVGTTVAWGTVQSGEFHRYFETGARCLDESFEREVEVELGGLTRSCGVRVGPLSWGRGWRVQ